MIPSHKLRVYKGFPGKVRNYVIIAEAVNKIAYVVVAPSGRAEVIPMNYRHKYVTLAKQRGIAHMGNDHLKILKKAEEVL